jgi:hypothetical protein
MPFIQQFSKLLFPTDLGIFGDISKENPMLRTIKRRLKHQSLRLKKALRAIRSLCVQNNIEIPEDIKIEDLLLAEEIVSDDEQVEEGK